MKFLKYFIFGFAYFIAANSNASSIYSDSSVLTLSQQFKTLPLYLEFGYGRTKAHNNEVTFVNFRPLSPKPNFRIGVRTSLILIPRKDVESLQLSGALFYQRTQFEGYLKQDNIFLNQLGSSLFLNFIGKGESKIFFGFGITTFLEIGSKLQGYSPYYSNPSVDFPLFNLGPQGNIGFETNRLRFSLESLFLAKPIFIEVPPGTSTTGSAHQTATWDMRGVYFTLAYRILT